jgi:hypothetical protein
MSISLERAEALAQLSDELLHETRELLAQLQSKSDRLLRETCEMSDKLHSLACERVNEASVRPNWFRAPRNTVMATVEHCRCGHTRDEHADRVNALQVEPLGMTEADAGDAQRVPVTVHGGGECTVDGCGCAEFTDLW